MEKFNKNSQLKKKSLTIKSIRESQTANLQVLQQEFLSISLSITIKEKNNQ